MHNIKLIHGSKKFLISQGNGVASLLGHQNSKTQKGEKLAVLTGIMYMQPTDQLCPMSTAAGCRAPCLVTAGLASVYDTVKNARKKRTELFEKNTNLFFSILIKEIDSFVKRAKRNRMTPAIRLNGTSDINWAKYSIEGRTLFEIYSDVTFYDYTKSPAIIRDSVRIPNWYVVASYSGASDKYAELIKSAANRYGANLAVVFPKNNVPRTFLGRKVIDGDESDARFLDEKNTIVALSAKGDAKKDTSGFVVRLDDIALN